MSDMASEVERASPRGEVWRGLKSALPVMGGFVPFALVLGAQASQKGLSPIEVPLLTGINFGGGSEFAAIGLWTSPPHILLIVAMTFLVNCRHILMGQRLHPISPISESARFCQRYISCAMKPGRSALPMRVVSAG